MDRAIPIPCRGPRNYIESHIEKKRVRNHKKLSAAKPQPNGQSLSRRERDAAKRQGEGSNAETFQQAALTRPSATLSRWERASPGKIYQKNKKILGPLALLVVSPVYSGTA